jgi:hypothetical protein
MEWPEPAPSATAVVDTSVELFAALLPLQDASTCSKIISEVMESSRSGRLDKNAGRKAAISVNSTIALALALRTATASHARHCRDTMGSTKVNAPLAAFLKVSLLRMHYMAF